ncbi:hypothetical protein DRY97_05680 [Salmonella enterica subsp. arizonae]|nr:hypothetical protein [Salmonella enterica]ECJ4840020.1 hypothetical protein [Salmonella enterica subsp. arizonae]EDS2498596.1 hypothetical protein [Salmonella enterica subsp. arizonae serovar 51:z4,z23:-]EDV4868324.1 hypothetical protein [Salmonella enterica subsp. enterica]EBJ1199339.1 hypothetical protein [Salmonella enterica]
MNINDTMVIFLNDDGVSLQIAGQSAGYYPNGKMAVFCGTDRSIFPKGIVLHDRRHTKSRSSDAGQ